jgi:hypothetical protein
MNVAALARRVEMLEETVESLKRVPDHIGALEVRVGSLESQVLQLRTEMGDGFSAVRHEIAELPTSQVLAGFATRTEMHAMKAELQDDIYGVNRDLTGHIVETQRQMRVLYEDLVARITTIGESRSGKS